MSRHAANIVLLRRKVSEPLDADYSLQNAQQILDDLTDYSENFDEELLELKGLATRVEATDDIRQHSLQVLLDKGDKPGHHGVNEEIWAEVVRTSVKASAAGLQTKVDDIAAMILFKEEALQKQLEENEILKNEAELFPDREDTPMLGDGDKPRESVVDKQVNAGYLVRTSTTLLL